MTLVELMIAILIGLFLIGGVIQIFLNSKQSYRMQENLSRIQENGRFAVELLSHDIRQARYIGCSSVSATNPVVIANSPLVAPVAHAGIPAVVNAHAVTGGDNKTSFTSPTPALSPVSLATNVTQNTDAITVQFGESCGAYITSAMSGVDPAGKISGGHTCGTISAGTPLVISDCATAHIFRAATDDTKNKDSAGTATAVLGKSYAVGSEIMLFRSYTYFIRNNALYRLDNNSAVAGSTNPVELIEGVENMQIVYGVDDPADADFDANFYVPGTAANIPAADWAKVTSLRIYLLLQSAEDNLNANSVPYVYAGNAAVTPLDRRLRKVFTASIKLRN